MRSVDDDEIDRLLDEQRAYYRARAEDYFVAECLKPAGRVFLVDDAYRTPDELIEGPSSSTIRRQIADGTTYRLVKVPHEPADLKRRLRRRGWQIEVTSTAGLYYWGAGSRDERPT